MPQADSTGKTYQQTGPSDFSAANRLWSDAMKMQLLGSSMISGAFTDAGNVAQARRDADYYNQLSQYANDPIGMAQALQNGTINSSGISNTAAKDTRDYLTSAATNWSSNTKTADEEFLRQQNEQFSPEVQLYKDLMKQGKSAEAAKVANGAIGRGANARIFTEAPNYTLDQVRASTWATAVGLQKDLENRADWYAQQILPKAVQSIGGMVNSGNGEFVDPALLHGLIYDPTSRIPSDLRPIVESRLSAMIANKANNENGGSNFLSNYNNLNTGSNTSHSSQTSNQGSTGVTGAGLLDNR